MLSTYDFMLSRYDFVLSTYDFILSRYDFVSCHHSGGRVCGGGDFWNTTQGNGSCLLPSASGPVGVTHKERVWDGWILPKGPCQTSSLSSRTIV